MDGTTHSYGIPHSISVRLSGASFWRLKWEPFFLKRATPHARVLSFALNGRISSYPTGATEIKATA